MSAEEHFVDSDVDDPNPHSVVLDIGGDVGALIVYADEACLGLELEVSPTLEAHGHRTHTVIRRRRAVSRALIAGVYPELTEGPYTVWGLDGTPLAGVEIVGGQVTEYHAGDCRLSKRVTVA